MTAEEKVAFIKYWSDWFYRHSDTFRWKLGLELAYLWPAIIQGHKIEVSKRSPLVRMLLENRIDESDKIWSYIDVVE